MIGILRELNLNHFYDGTDQLAAVEEVVGIERFNWFFIAAYSINPSSRRSV
jgi:hypothetical protein